MILSPHGVCCMTAVAIILSTSVAVAAPNLFSYDATYSVQLARASLSTGPRAASGVLDYRFTESCNGWQTRTSVSLDLTFRDGSMITNKRDFTSLESKDGRDYTFAVRTIKGDVPVEAFRGAAKMAMRGGGSVVYELPTQDPAAKPRKVTISLPAGTLLSVRHALALLSRAEKGERQFRSLVFNGASSVGPRAMSTVIGQPLASTAPNGSAEPSEIDAGLLAVPAWDLNLAYYNLFERRDTPNFEVFQRYYSSGITPSFEQQFDDFTIRADLDRLQRITPEPCPAPDAKKKSG
ncbi:MAG: DUF1849 family protein [Rhodospirillaceae bacterium]|nr:DUF1849 family protein [Rhodospirillaceae bacterium]